VLGFRPSRSHGVTPCHLLVLGAILGRRFADWFADRPRQPRWPDCLFRARRSSAQNPASDAAIRALPPCGLFSGPGSVQAGRGVSQVVANTRSEALNDAAIRARDDKSPHQSRRFATRPVHRAAIAMTPSQGPRKRGLRGQERQPAQDAGLRHSRGANARVLRCARRGSPTSGAPIAAWSCGCDLSAARGCPRLRGPRQPRSGTG
jgi:hypothetical protein